MSLDGLPMDGASKRRAKLFLLAEYAYTFPDGVSHTKMMDLGIGWGNRPERIEEYIATIVSMGLVTKRANRYFVEGHNFREWAERNGYIEVPKDVVCLECGQRYNTNHVHCPNCGSVDRKLFKPEGVDSVKKAQGAHTHTHIHMDGGPEQLEMDSIQLQPSLVDGMQEAETREANTHTYTHIHESESPNDSPMSPEGIPREQRVEEGGEAELRVVELLNGFGRAVLGKGSYGEPDVLFYTEANRYAVEVKSIEQMRKTEQEDVNGYKANVVTLNRNSWEALCEYAEACGLSPLLVVEVKISGSKYGNLYYMVPREAVDYKANQSNARYIRLSVYDLPALSVQSFRPGLPFIGRCVL